MKIARRGGSMTVVGAKGAEMAKCQNPEFRKNIEKKRRSSSQLKRRAGLMVIIGASLLGSTGCNLLTSSVKVAAKDVHSWVDDSMSNYRDRTLAEKAWIRVRSEYRQHEYTNELKRGFIAGYQAVAGGGNGCTPPIAPSEYWGWKYQSPFGQAAVRAWFEGYPLGAKAAEEDGIGNWSRVQLNLRQPQEFQAIGEPASDSDSAPPQPTILEPAATDSAAIPSPSDLPAVPSLAIGFDETGADQARVVRTPNANAFDAFMNQASSTAVPMEAPQKSGLELPDTVSVGAIKMTGPEEGDGKVESPASYDDWLNNVQGDSPNSEPSSTEINFKFDSESDLPFTLE